MSTLKKIIHSIIIAVIMYIVFAFIAFDFNPVNWWWYLWIKTQFAGLLFIWMFLIILYPFFKDKKST